MPLNQITLATNGAYSMTGHRTWLAAGMRGEVPTLINVYCIAHCEVLDARDATMFESRDLLTIMHASVIGIIHKWRATLIWDHVLFQNSFLLELAYRCFTNFE